jgi:hypothetical protein
MDPHGARHLMARLAIGAPVGARVEVITVNDARSPLRPGDTGTLVSIDDTQARLQVDTQGDVDVDPFTVRLRPILRRTA